MVAYFDTAVLNDNLYKEAFPASVRYLWDENALMYIKYETMYLAKELLLRELEERI